MAEEFFFFFGAGFGIFVVEAQAFLWTSFNAGAAGDASVRVDLPGLIVTIDHNGSGRAFPLAQRT